MSNDVDSYVRRSRQWPTLVVEVRELLLGCGLDEALKWGKPCYAAGGRNVVIVQEMKEFLALMFFQGALLSDPQGLLVEQGPNSRSAKRVELRSADDLRRHADAIRALVAEAVDVAASGATVERPELELVDELRELLDGDAALRAAFDALTPGRQREYHLHVSGAKQAGTRRARAAECADRILAGKGLRDR